MPNFCRHNRLIQNCSICSREQEIEARPIVSSSAPGAGRARGMTTRTERAGAAPARRPLPGGSRSGGLRVRRLVRGEDDGYHCQLIPGIKSSADAGRLAAELAFAAVRLERLNIEPPGLYAEVAAPGDIEERTWLAFVIAYISPRNPDAPFAEIDRVRTSWVSGELPDLGAVLAGPRGSHAAGRGTRTLEAYRAWVTRAGTQAAAFAGDRAWSAERRFARVLERLALPGLHRDARYELLVSLGRLGLYELNAGTLALGGENEVTHAAKRALGIGDPLLLERRGQTLAEAVELPLEALDLGLYNWERGERATVGFPAHLDADPDALGRIRRALGL